LNTFFLQLEIRLMSIQHPWQTLPGAALVASITLAGLAQATVVTQTANDPGGSSSFTSGTNWSDGLVPSSGKDYETAKLIRTPSGGSPTFAGNSLTIKSPGGLALIGGAAATVSNLIIESGGIIGNSSGGTTPSLAGNITLNGNLVWTTNTADIGGSRHSTVTASISGTGGIEVANKSTDKNSSGGVTNGSLTLSASNSFTGGVTIYGAVLKAGNAGALNSTNPNLVTFYDSSPGYFNTNGYSIAVRGLETGTTVGTPTVQNASSIAATLTLKPQSGDDYTYARLIQDGTGGGALSLAINGAGTQRLSYANTYTGATLISDGVLELSGSGAIISTSGITINGGELKQNSSTTVNQPITFTAGTISGTGTIGAAVSGGTGSYISPGNSVATQTYSAGLDYSAGMTYVWELDDFGTVAGTDSDLINLSGGNLALGGTSALSINFISGVTNPDGGNSFWNTDRTWKVIDVTGSGTNTGNTNVASLVNGTYTSGFFSTSVGTGGDAGDIFLHFTVVPEPTSMALLLVGLIGLNRFRCRRI
jgi:fibronectin-binding autotransporter adhesin